MKQLLKDTRSFVFLIAGILFTEIALSQTRPMRTVFETNRVDSATGLEKPQVYRLKKQVENADFAYSKLQNMLTHIGDTVNPSSLMSIFNPVKGKYQYFQFVATFKAEGYRGIGDYHDVLIVKTTSDGKIVDAYHYTLEWAEMPLQYDLYRSSAKNIFLTDNLDLSLLKFVNQEGETLNEKGTLKLK